MYSCVRLALAQIALRLFAAQTTTFKLLLLKINGFVGIVLLLLKQMWAWTQERHTLLILPVRLTTILPALWSSTISNSPMYPDEYKSYLLVFQSHALWISTRVWNCEQLVANAPKKWVLATRISRLVASRWVTLNSPSQRFKHALQ